jgi:hypothetical protein
MDHFCGVRDFRFFLGFLEVSAAALILYLWQDVMVLRIKSEFDVLLLLCSDFQMETCVANRCPSTRFPNYSV